MMIKFYNLLVCSILFLNSKTYCATVQYNQFPQGNYIKTQVDFWYKVFNKYHSWQSVIHDSKYPELIVDVIDFKVFAKRYNKGIPYTNKQMHDITEKYKQRYYQASQRFKLQGKSAINYGPIERRIFQVYSTNAKYRQRLYSKRLTLRGQAGLKDEFKRAAKRSLSYIHEMEQIFDKHGIPKNLTRIAFVESMFNEKAISKVGASGIWQFMPSTARDYVIVDKYIDERNSPIKATEAAAKLLKANYRLLGSWPLAVTAYNYGAGGLINATHKLKTKDFNVIALEHHGKTFGFASRNFYSEFLAAMITYNQKYANPKLAKIKSDTVKLKIPSKMNLTQVYKNLNIVKDP